MGKKKHLGQIEELFKKSPVVDFQSIKRRVKSESYAKTLVNYLIKRGKISKLAKGRYTRYNETALAVFCFQPAYLGLQSALSYYRIWEQETIPVILTARPVRTGIRDVNGSNIFIRKVRKRYMFGFSYEQEGDFYIPYSDLEKTVIDMVVFRQRMDKAVLKKLKEKINKKTLITYLKRYPKKTRDRVRKVLNPGKPKAI